MRLIQTLCQVDYKGRGETSSTKAVRLIIVKDDGTTIIHRDRKLAPMNWMAPNPHVEHDEYTDEAGYEHFVASSRNETIDVTMFEVMFDMTLDFDDDEDELSRVGTERQMQEWLSREGNFQAALGADSRFIKREYKTNKGAVDLVGEDEAGRLMLVECKRTAKKSDVFQVIRYREAVADAAADAMRRESMLVSEIGASTPTDLPLAMFEEPVGFLVSETERAGVRSECEKHGVRFVKLGTKWRRDGVEIAEARRVTSPTSSSEIR